MSRVFVLGNATVDLTLTVSGWPLPGETILATHARRGPGGKGLNQAVAASRAGADVTLCAPVGEDADGDFLTGFVARQPKLTPRWRRCPTVTDISTIWVADKGENMIVSSADCARSVAPSEVAALLDGLARGDCLVMQGNLSADTTMTAARHARDLGAWVILNTAPIDWDMTALLPLADILICNQPEAALLTGGGAGEEAIRLLLRSGAAQVLLTLGAQGAIAGDGGDLVRLAAPAVHAVDTSGAGDVVAGYLTAGLLQGLGFQAAGARAIRAAAMSVTRPGTIDSCPMLEEVNR